jgi:hypothetical protein
VPRRVLSATDRAPSARHERDTARSLSLEAPAPGTAGAFGNNLIVVDYSCRLQYLANLEC